MNATHLTPSEYLGFARGLVRSAPRDADSWLCLGHALEAQVWGIDALQELPSWPWSIRSPLVQQHFAHARGDPDAALVAPELDIRALEHDEVFKDIQKQVRFVEEDGKYTLRMEARAQARSPLVKHFPEIVRHEAWVASLRKGFVADDVRQESELCALTPSEVKDLSEAAKAYARAARMDLNADQIATLIAALRRLVICECLDASESLPNPFSMAHGSQATQMQKVGAAELCRAIDESASIPPIAKAEARFRLEAEHLAPGWSLETSEPFMVGSTERTSGDEVVPKVYPAALVEAAEDWLHESLSLLLDECPGADVAQVEIEPGYIAPPLPRLDEAVSARIRRFDALVDRIVRLMTFLTQVESMFHPARALALAMVRERWMNVIEQTEPFYWVDPAVDPFAHYTMMDDKGNETAARVPVSAFLEHAAVWCGTGKVPTSVGPPPAWAELNELADLLVAHRDPRGS